MKIVFLLLIFGYQNTYAQIDTLPNSYCDCIDTSKIIGNKDDFYKSFEQVILKKSLTALQQLDTLQLHEYFTDLYKSGFIIEQHYNEKGELIYYPSNTNIVCDLLQKFLNRRLQNEAQKKRLEFIADTLNLNANKEFLKFRIWLIPTFSKRKLIEIYEHPSLTNQHKIIAYTFKNYGFSGLYHPSDLKLDRKLSFHIDYARWQKFVKQSNAFELKNLPLQNDVINYRIVTKDGYRVTVEIYEAGKMIHLLDYISPNTMNGKAEHLLTFNTFYELVLETFYIQPFEQ